MYYVNTYKRATCSKIHLLGDQGLQLSRVQVRGLRRQISVFYFFVSLFMNSCLFRFASSVPQWRRQGVLWGMLPDARNNIPNPEQDLLLHIARQPKGRMVPSLVKSAAQRHDLLALQSSAVLIHSHKMAAAAPDIISSFNYGQMLPCLFFFLSEKKTFLRIIQQTSLASHWPKWSQFLSLI